MSASTVSYPYNHDMPSHEDNSQDMSSLFNYAKMMHEHTRKQMEAVDKAARRKGANADGTNAHATLRTGHKAIRSLDSTSSAGSHF